MRISLLLQIPLLIFGVFCCATAVIMIKVSTVDPMLLAGLRLVVATVILSPLFFINLQRHRAVYSWRHLIATLAPGFFLAVHFISWIIGARLTPAANSSLIVNLVPVAMPFFLLGAAGERLTRTEWLATAVALAGVVLLAGADLNLSSAYFRGDLICFGSMLTFAGYLVAARRNRDFPSLWLYVVPLYAAAGAMCLAASLAFENPFRAYPAKDVMLVLALGIVPTVFGHSILNWAMKHMRGQVVSILNLGQFIFAGVLAFVIFNERPHLPFYIAASLIVCGGLMVVRQTIRGQQTAPLPAMPAPSNRVEARGEELISAAEER